MFINKFSLLPLKLHMTNYHNLNMHSNIHGIYRSGQVPGSTHD